MMLLKVCKESALIAHKELSIYALPVFTSIQLGVVA